MSAGTNGLMRPPKHGTNDIQLLNTHITLKSACRGIEPGTYCMADCKCNPGIAIQHILA